MCWGDVWIWRSSWRRSGQPARGKDIEVDVSLTFREVAFGVEKVIRLYRHTQCSRCHGDGAESGSTVKTCATCKGEGQVRQLRQTMFGTMQTVATCQDCHGRGKKPEKMCTLCRGTGLERREEDVRLPIPAGIASEEAIRVSGQGEGAPYGGIPGDLFIRVRVQADPVFRREDHDVLSEKRSRLRSLLWVGKSTFPFWMVKSVSIFRRYRLAQPLPCAEKGSPICVLAVVVIIVSP